MAEPGQDNWIEQAIAAYESPLLRYALHFVRDADTARDIVQDTFLQLCRNQKLELRERMPQWLYTVCRNRAIDLIRKERRVKQMAECDDNSSRATSIDPVDPAANPTQAAEAVEAD